MATTKNTPEFNELDYRFAGYGFQNWCAEGVPPVIVNRAATVHAKLAWCWGEVKQIEDLASVLCTNKDEELARIGNLLVYKSMALIAMLEHVADTTMPGRKWTAPDDHIRVATQSTGETD